MTTPTYRSPLRLVTANGTPLPKVLSARVVRGWDQMLATCDVVIPWPPPPEVGKWSAIRVSMGATALVQRFTGYVTGLNNTLWPGTMALQCEDKLALAKYFKPSSDHDLSNKTDEAAVKYILTQVGIPYTPSLILGTGKKVGAASSQALTWTRKETALSKIQQLDQVSAKDHGSGHLTMFRTYADAAGSIRRVELANVPGTTAARSFVEGVDLEAGNARIENVEPKTIVTVAGDRGILTTVDDSGGNTWAVVTNPDFYPNPMLQQAAEDATYLGTDTLAAVLLQRFNLNLIRIQFTTPREDLIGAIETDYFDSDHCMVTLNAFVQSVVTEQAEDGGFSQQVALVSAREFNINPKAVKQFNPFNGKRIVTDPPPPPYNPDRVQAAFEVLAIDVELVIVAGVETLVYTAVCQDASTSSGGTITTRAWTTTGSPTPSSGDGVSFNPTWDAGGLATATVTLAVTDSLSITDTITQTISLTMGVPVRCQDMYAAATDALEAFRAADRTWHRYTTGIVDCEVVANGPLWADGDTVYRSSDYLATAPSSSIPSPGVDVVCIWTELDLDADSVAAGLIDGTVAFSSDAGATWTVRDGPDAPSPVLKVILSRFSPGEVHAITATGYYTSGNQGIDWGLIRAGSYLDLDLNPFRNWAVEIVTVDGVMIDAVTGTANSGTTGADLVCVTSHITADRGYALASDGRAYLLDTDGDTALTLGTDIPAGLPQPRGMYRSPFADVVYYAAGSGGVGKTVDGFRATYYPLRSPGVGSAGSGPWVQIGAGLLQAEATFPSGDIDIWYASLGGLAGYTIATDSWSDHTPDPANGGQEIVAAYGDYVWTGSGFGDAGYPLWYSVNRGSSWTSVTLPGNADGLPIHLMATADTLVMTYQDDSSNANIGVWIRPLDGTGSWTHVWNDGGTNPQNAALEGGRLWIANSAAVRDFQYITPVSSGSTHVSSTPIDTGGGTSMGVIATPGDETVAFGCLAFNAVNLRGRVYRFNDAVATNITPGAAPSGSFGLGFIGLAAKDANTLLAYFYEGGGTNTTTIYKSTDGGSSWTSVSTHIAGNGLFNPIAWSNSVAGLVAARALSTTILYSTDDGDTWTESSTQAITGGYECAVAVP